MTIDPIAIDTDVLVIGSGAAGMYAAIEAARGGAQVLLADRSLIGRGGATVMAQMTVAAALGEEMPDDLAASLRRHHRGRPRPVRRAAGAAPVRGRARLHPRAGSLGRRLGAQGRPHHRRPSRRAMTGRAASMSISSTPARRCRRRCAPRCARNQTIRKAGDLCIVDLVATRRRGLPAPSPIICGTGAPVVDRREGDRAGDRRPDAALPAQQRLGQYGRRRLCAGAARRRAR